MVRITGRALNNWVYIDEYDTPENPVDPKYNIFRNVVDDIILPISEFFCDNHENSQTLNYFVMKRKRAYNSDEMRNHICRYLNYFERFYDTDKQLLQVLYKIKFSMDYFKEYKRGAFMQDINKYIICNKLLVSRVRNFVHDNYKMALSSNNNKTPNLQFDNKHAKILYEMSLIMNMYIVPSVHYMYIHGIRQREDIEGFMLELFSYLNDMYMRTQGVDMYSKLYETSLSVANKSKNPDKILWEKNLIRGNNITTHTKHAVIDCILQIIPKYNYLNNVINFNYASNRQTLRYNILDIAYEFPFHRMSSSKRDMDQNSELDRYEARLNKKDESLSLQNEVSAEQTIRNIELRFGPFEQDEIDHYRKSLIKNGAPLVEPLQKQMIGYLFYKDFGDPITIKAIHNQTDYIKLIIAAKRILLAQGMITLPYMISGKISKSATKKATSKRDKIRIEESELFNHIMYRYGNNPKVAEKLWQFIGNIKSTQYTVIDYDTKNHCPSNVDGVQIPLSNDFINAELLDYVSMI